MDNQENSLGTTPSEISCTISGVENETKLDLQNSLISYKFCRSSHLIVFKTLALTPRSKLFKLSIAPFQNNIDQHAFAEILKASSPSTENVRIQLCLLFWNGLVYVGGASAAASVLACRVRSSMSSVRPCSLMAAECSACRWSPLPCVYLPCNSARCINPEYWALLVIATLSSDNEFVPLDSVLELVQFMWTFHQLCLMLVKPTFEVSFFHLVTAESTIQCKLR